MQVNIYAHRSNFPYSTYSLSALCYLPDAALCNKLVYFSLEEFLFHLFTLRRLCPM